MAPYSQPRPSLFLEGKPRPRARAQGIDIGHLMRQQSKLMELVFGGRDLMQVRPPPAPATIVHQAVQALQADSPYDLHIFLFPVLIHPQKYL